MRTKLFIYSLFIIINLYGQEGKNYLENRLSQYDFDLNYVDREFPNTKLKSISSNSVLDSIVFYEINKEFSLYTGKIIYLYSDNVLTTTEEYKANLSYGFEPYTKYYTYNSNNKIEKINAICPFDFDDFSMPIADWGDLSERKTYNKEGLIIQSERFFPDCYSSRGELFTYYENGFLKTYTKYRIEGEYADTTTKEMYVYPDTIDNMKVKITLRWDDGYNKWVNSRKAEITLNSYGNRTLWEECYWRASENVWHEYLKEEIFYGKQNELLTKIIYRYNSSDTSLKEFIKEEYEYFTDGDIKNVNYYDIHIFYGTWNLYRKDIYHYSGKVTGVNQNLYASQNIKIYPNPADNILLIHSGSYALGKYSIFNIHGQLVQFGELDKIPENKIDISNLNNGVYIIRIQNKDSKNEVFLKFIKR